MSIYVNVPQTINKMNKLYNETGRKRRITKMELSEMLNLGRSATDNYFYDAQNYGAIETLTPHSFKISDDMINLIKHRDAYHRKVYQLVLSHKTFRQIIKRFENKIPAHSTLMRFLMRDLELKQSAATKTLHNYYKTAEWLDSQNLYKFDDYFDFIDDLDEIDAVSSTDEALNLINDIQKKIEEKKRKPVSEKGNKIKINLPEQPPTIKTPKHHKLDASERHYLNHLDRRIAAIKDKIERYEAELPQLKSELYELQKERFELLNKK